MSAPCARSRYASEAPKKARVRSDRDGRRARLDGGEDVAHPAQDALALAGAVLDAGTGGDPVQRRHQEAEQRVIVIKGCRSAMVEVAVKRQSIVSDPNLTIVSLGPTLAANTGLRLSGRPRWWRGLI